MQNLVEILFTGYSHSDPDDASSMRANCTCTLIRTCSGRNVIVDTRTAWDGHEIVQALQAHGLQPSDISAVVCTHGHSDHIGCNYLFPEAKWHFVGACFSHSDKYFEWGTDDDAVPFQLDGDVVTVHRTPGHTLSCVSVVVRDTQLGDVVGICGDLFERCEDIGDSSIWLNAGSENAQSQRQQRLRLAEMCSYIIPGHGAGFAVTQEMREQLRKELSNCHGTNPK